MPKLYAARRIGSRGFQVQAHIALLAVLRPHVGIELYCQRLIRLIAVLRSSAVKIGERQILFVPKPVAQELDIPIAHGPRPAKQVHSLHACVLIPRVQVKRKHKQCAGVFRPGQVCRQRGKLVIIIGQSVKCNLHILYLHLYRCGRVYGSGCGVRGAFVKAHLAYLYDVIVLSLLIAVSCYHAQHRLAAFLYPAGKLLR